MRYQNKLLKKSFSFFLLIACSFLFVVINSCNNATDQPTNTTTASTNKTDNAKAEVGTVSINLSNYRINATDLPAITGGVGQLNPSKLLLKFEFANINDPLNTMNLLLYPATNHGHYGANTNPIQVTPTVGPPTQLDVTSLVLGNNEIVTSDLMRPPPNHHTYKFDHLILIPTFTTQSYDNKPHLVFKIKVYNHKNEDITATATFAIPDTNPCPPNQPGN
ncbi:MAG TPA: hypothetical protein VK492_03810 [Chitinophagaceae bacterium]|nr:hypothetical protein [Chitinophagaceae bacterium]